MGDGAVGVAEEQRYGRLIFTLDTQRFGAVRINGFAILGSFLLLESALLAGWLGGFLVGARQDLVIGLLSGFVAVVAIHLRFFSPNPALHYDRLCIYENGLLPLRRLHVAFRGKALHVSHIAKILCEPTNPNEGEEFVFSITASDRRSYVVSSSELRAFDLDAASIENVRSAMLSLQGRLSNSAFG